MSDELEPRRAAFWLTVAAMIGATAMLIGAVALFVIAQAI